MCIIVIKPKNKKIPDKILLNRCFKNNQDGIGYMYVNNKEVVIRKGFMSFDDFYNNLLSDYKKNNLNKKDNVALSNYNIKCIDDNINDNIFFQFFFNIILFIS